MQAPFRCQGCLWHDIIDRAQSQFRKAGIPDKAVIAEVVVAVADEDVEDHALKALAGVSPDDIGVTEPSAGLRQLSIGLDGGVHGGTREERQTADEPQTSLHLSRCRCCAPWVFGQLSVPARFGPVSVESLDQHHSPDAEAD